MIILNMKVLVTRSSENQTTGGAELSARDQALVLKEIGHEPVFSSNNRSLRASLDDHNIQTLPNLYLQRFKPPVRYVYFWLLLPIKALYDLALALFIRPDIINPHSREDQLTFTLLKPLHRRPVVWKDPGDIVFVLKQTHGRIGSLYKNLYLYAASRADHIYVLNDSHKDALLKAVPNLSSNSVSVVPSSILYQQYSPNKHSDTEVATIGSICRLVESKDIATLIKAYLSIAERIQPSKLLIVGDGPERTALERLASDNDNIIFAGQSNDVSTYYNQMDIFVNPALEEGWGRNVKEAMYFGKAVIGSNTGGIARQITHGVNGLLFSPGSVDELAESIYVLSSNNNLREQLGAAAHNKAMGDGDFTRIVVEMIVPIYERYLR